MFREYNYPPEPRIVGECASGACGTELYEGYGYFEYDEEYFCAPGCVTDKLLDLQIISPVDL